MRNKQILLQKIKKGKAKIAVIGLGYVGLPLALLLAKKGFTVNGYTKTERKADLINQGTCSVSGYKKALKKVLTSGNFSAHTIKDRSLKNNDIYIICIPTPIDKQNKPDLSILKGIAKRLSEINLTNKLIINESTVAPFTTRTILGSLHKYHFLACSPERIDPGTNSKTTENIPKIISGIDNESLELGVALYNQVLKKPLVIVKSMEAAELSKMLENTYRAVNIALVNEFARLSDAIGVDIIDVINAAKTKWSFQAHYPSIGVGGHCIKVDPHYLLKLANDKGILMNVVINGLLENDSMPEYVANKVIANYKKNMSVLVYGLTYKKNVADLRESPVISFCNILKQKNILFTVYDPLLAEKKIEQLGFKVGKLGKVDMLIVGTDHQELNLDYQLIIGDYTVVIDGRNFFQDGKVGKKVVGVGRSLE